MKQSAPETRPVLIARVVLSLPFGVVGTIVAYKALSDGDPMFFLLGCGAIIVFGALVAPILAQAIGDSVGRAVYQGKTSSKPQPAFSIPRSQRMLGHYEEAIKELREITVEFPDEVEAWLQMVEIALLDLKDPERARLMFHEGLSTLKDLDDRQKLVGVFKSLSSRAKVREAGNQDDDAPLTIPTELDLDDNST